MIRVEVAAGYASVRAGLQAIVARAEGLSLEPPADVLLIELADDERLPEDGPVVALVTGPAEVRRLSGRAAPWAALPRDAEEAAIAAALRAVAAGLVVLDPAFLVAQPLAANVPEGEGLTPREREVLQLMAAGLPNKTIAQRLGLSEHTVKFHAAALFAKLGAASRTEAVTLGLRAGEIAV